MTNTTVLVVDDEPQLRRVMLATLTDLGYTVIDAKSGEEALEKFRQEQPDLVLLDLNMPGIGGIETCRALHMGADVPIMFYSRRIGLNDGSPIPIVAGGRTTGRVGRYSLGLSSIIELSQAELNQTSARIEQASAMYDYQAQYSVLNYQLGALR